MPYTVGASSNKKWREISWGGIVILVTVGMQLSFDRLIEAMDKLAPSLDLKIIAQTGRGTYIPRNMETQACIGPRDFERLMEQAQLVVSHAGIGTLLTASRLSKPVVMLPRRAQLGEHRNDHQIATCKQLEKRPGIFVAFEETELPSAIKRGLPYDASTPIAAKTASKLQLAIASFIEGKAL